MFLADTIVTPPATAIVTTLDGVTTVLTAFIFVCLVLPSLVRNKSQFYAALACVAGIIVLHTAMLMFGIITLGPIGIGMLQLLALILLVLSVGGLTAHELTGDMAKAYEVVRRGETEKEVIIPIADRPPVAVAAPRKVRQSNPTPVIDPDDDTEDKGIPLS